MYRYFSISLLLVLAVFSFCKNENTTQNSAEQQRMALQTKAAVKIRPYADSVRAVRDLLVLSSDSLQGRLTGSEGGQKARKHIVERLVNMGIKNLNAPMEQPFECEQKGEKVTGVNVVGYVPGLEKPGKYIVISAHYDHLGVQDGAIYHGADDNASGVAALLNAAQYYAVNPPVHSLIFCLFDAEEIGLQGAAAFVKNLPVPKESILANLNMDMVGRSESRELFFSGGYHYPKMTEIAQALQAKTNVKIMTGHDRPQDGKDDWTEQSDHAVFHKAGIPYLYLGVEDHPDYHKPTDTADKIDKGFFVEVCNLVIETINKLDLNF